MDYIDRPASVPIVSWIWIVSGALTIVSCIMSIGALSDLPELVSDKDLSRQAPSMLAMMRDLSHYMIWLTVLQMVMAVLAIAAGVYYLKLRAWARGTLELLTWVSLAMLIGFGFFWPPLWMMTSEHFLPKDGSIDLEKVKMAGAVAGAVVMLVLAIPLAMMIRSLRSKAVREAIRRAAAGGR